MKLPNIYTLVTKTENDDMPITAIFLNHNDLMEEINTLIFETDDIREIFRDAFNGFFEEISSEDICTMENPIMAYLEGKYRLLYKDFNGNKIPDEFIEGEFRNGMLFNSSDTHIFMDITCHIPQVEGNQLQYRQV